jgi:hypothetical protein
MTPGGDDDVPRLPRGRGLRMRSGDVVRIGLFGTLLVMILALGHPCASGVAGFVDSFSPPPDAAPPAAGGMQLERLTDEQIRERFPAEPPSKPRDQAAGRKDGKDAADGVNGVDAPRPRSSD